MLESIIGIAFSTIATFLGSYLSNKNMTRLSDKAKWKIAKTLIIISYSSVAILAVYSMAFILSGLMGMAGVHGWEFQLYDNKRQIILLSGLSFESRLEPIWFIVRGVICIGACMMLNKIAIPRLKKINKPELMI